MRSESVNLVVAIATIIAIAFSPIIAVSISEWLYSKREVTNRKKEILDSLIAYRHRTGTEEFIKALNSISITFKDYPTVIKLRNDFYNKVTKKRPEEEKNVALTQLILEVCRVMGYRNIQEADISQVFRGQEGN